MHPDQQRIDSIFLAAAEKATAAERAAYLDVACASEPELRERVERLLAAQSKVSRFLETPAPALMGTVDEPPATERPGTVVGPYKLLEQIGEGGMGAVWMAEQTEPIQRRVAVKVVKEGMDSRQVLARFEAERQALALMEHPNIAKVLDAGKTPSGRPYFVMELVKGQPITRYCDGVCLGVRDRLELFGDVCRAVQHAHQKGIIHRDLKPSNVLVAPYDGKPVVKVIDFGVAKATGQRLTEKTLFTGFGALVGTPEYMSPEQAEVNNQDIDTRSDIYSLGVLLYELLTGSTPLMRQRIQEAPLLEVLRVIREEEPPRPSTRLSESKDSLPSISAQRQTEPAKLTRLVRGELDWIVMKALEKDRNRRYETANAFAQDVQRYLADEPVLACPPSSAYRFRKLVRRNKRAVTVAAVILALVLAGTAVSTWQAIRATLAERDTRDALAQVTAEQAKAQEALDEAREALDTLTDDVVQTMFARQPQLDAPEKEFLRKVLKHHEAVARQEAETPKGRFIRAKGQYQVAYLRDRLGQQREALTGYQQAAALLQQLADQFPDEAVYRHKLARAQNNLGVLLAKLGEQADAEAAFRRGIDLRSRLVEDSPNNLDYLRELATNYNDLGALRQLQHKYAEAEENYRHCLELQRKLIAKAGDQPRYHLQLARTLSNLGQLMRLQEKYAQSEEIYRQALKVQEEQMGKGPATARDRQWLANSYMGLGRALALQKNMPEAETAFQQALEIRRKLADDYPGVLEHHHELANGIGDFAYFLVLQKKYAAAEEPYRQALELRKAILQKGGPVPAYRRDLARSYYFLAEVHRRIDRPEAAESEWRAALELWQKLAVEFPKVPDFPNGAGSTLTNLAELHNKRGEFAAAVGLLKEARKQIQAALDARPKDRNFRESYRDYLAALGESRLGLADHVQLATTAGELAGFGYEPAQDTYDAATMLASAVTLVVKDAGLDEAKRKQLAQTYTDRALALLRQAIERGFQDAERMQKEPRLEPLRQRPEFGKLLAELEAKKK
jgi:serine/threonine protein kinase/tetratricopeptide (TPR) repeat protein